MPRSSLLIVGLAVLCAPTVFVLALCNAVINNGICPTGIAANAGFLALPTTCSSRGSCVFGACLCDDGWADVDCSKIERPLILGTVSITQSAFNEAPSRYADIVNQVFENFRSKNLEIPPYQEQSCLNYLLRTPLIPNWSITLNLDESSVRIQIIDGGLQVWANFYVAVPNVPVDAYVSNTPGTDTCCTAANVSLYQQTATCSLACSAAQGDHASVSFTAALTATMYPFFNSTTGQVQVSIPSQSLNVQFSPSNLNFQLTCNLASYPQLLFNLYNNAVEPWGDLLNTRLTEALQEEVQQQAAALSFGSTTGLNFTNATAVQVVATNMQFVGNSYVLVSLEGYVTKNRFYLDPIGCPLVQTTYIDTSPDALLPVPSDFSALQEMTVGAVPYLLQTLAQIRVSRSALKGVMWATLLDDQSLVRSITSYLRSYGVLDAKFNADFEWALPTFGFPVANAGNGSQQVTNTVRFQVQAGSSSLICNNTGQSQMSGQFAQFTLDLQPVAFGNVSTIGSLQNTNADPVFTFSGQLIAWDTSHINMNLTAPQKLSIPNALLKILIEQFLATKIPTANALLQQSALTVPSSLARFVVGPRLEAVHDADNPGRDGNNGFLVASVRCACVSNPSSSFVIVNTTGFGMEIVPRCVTACPSGRRMLESMNEVPQDLTTRVTHQSLRARRLTSSMDQLQTFLSSGKCGPTSGDNGTEFESAFTIALTCATSKQLSSVPGSSLSARYECMLQNVIASNVSSQGSCAPTSAMIRYFSSCQVPMSVAFPALFGDSKPCIEGSAFACSDTLAQIISTNCQCANPSTTYLLVKCNENALPIMLLSLGFGFPLIVYIVAFNVAGLCGCVNPDTWRNVKLALRMRVVRRSRDNFLINLAVVASLIFLCVVLAWMLQDPLEAFTKSIVQSDLFQLTDQMQTDFDTFMGAWSSVILFFMAMGSSQLFLFSLFSFYSGRCIWLKPLPHYVIKGYTGKVEEEGWTQIPPHIMHVWQWMSVVTINSIRFQSIMIIASFAVPPLFFPFRFSVQQANPQFGSTFLDSSFDIAANLTSLDTSANYMDAFVSIAGLSLMSSAVGFISSGLVYVFHGAAPGCFAAAQVIIYLMDRKDRRDREEYEKFSTLLPPPDNASLDRWRRIVFLFIWCQHGVGALGSSVAAIILYQILRAPVQWAVFWLTVWVLPLPLVFMSTSKRARTNNHIKFAIGYVLIFVVFTTAMVKYAPASAGFTAWLAALLIIAIFASVFLILLSEFLNIADQFESGQMLKDRLDVMMNVQHGTLSSPSPPPKTLRKRMKSIIAAPSDPVQPVSAVTAGNPLFESERRQLGGKEDEHDRMKRLASPSSAPRNEAPAPNQQQYQAGVARGPDPRHLSLAMAQAAENLQAKTNRRLSMVLDVDEEEIIAMMKSKEPSKRQQPISMALTPTQMREKERMRRRVLRRLEARGVEGPSANELAEKIAEYNAMKAAVEAQQVMQQRLLASARPAPLTPSEVEAQQVMQQRLLASARPAPLPPSATLPPSLASASRPPPPPPTATAAFARPAPINRQGSSSPSSPTTFKSRVEENRTIDPRVAAAASPTMRPRPPLSPVFSSSSSVSSTEGPKVQFESPRPIARAQAAKHTANSRLDDAYEAQFDPSRGKDLLSPPDFDGDDSFLSFLQEVATQLRRMAWESIQPVLENFKRRPPRPKRENSRPAVDHHLKHVEEHHYGRKTSFIHYRMSSRFFSWFNLRIRPIFASAYDIIIEGRETADPATYGLRIPLRRLFFIQGLLFMFILLIEVALNRVSVDHLKDEIIKLVLSASPIPIDTSTAYNWAGTNNVSTVLDASLAAYVDQSNSVYALLWFIFSLWVVSLVVEIIYSRFGRDMEEKRKGIKWARNISFLNLPLLLIVVVLPCAPDYVGLSSPSISNLVPACAPRLTSTVMEIVSNLFGVLTGTALAAQTMFVLLLIVPSISRALTFVVLREIIDLHKYAVFEPRKTHALTRSRLQNARFVWRLFPMLSPMLTYLPLLLVCQLIGKLYVSILTWVALVGPVVTAQVAWNREAEDQHVTAWLGYSTIWISLYVAPLFFIVLIEGLQTGQIAFVIKVTFQSWTWYLKIAAEVFLAIVVTSDMLYRFVASDAELEADSVINNYLEAIEAHALHNLNLERAEQDVAPVSSHRMLLIPRAEQDVAPPSPNRMLLVPRLPTI